jgi:hypothetical protein
VFLAIRWFRVRHFGHPRGGAARYTVSPVRIASVNRYAGDFSLVKDLRCARATPEASVGANNLYRGRRILQCLGGTVSGRNAFMQMQLDLVGDNAEGGESIVKTAIHVRGK